MATSARGNTVEILVKSKNQTRAGFASAERDAKSHAGRMNSILGGIGKGLLGGALGGGALAGGSGLLAMAGPLGALTAGFAAFGAVATTEIGKVEKKGAVLTGQQKQLKGAVDGLKNTWGQLADKMAPVITAVAKLAGHFLKGLMPALKVLVPAGANMIKLFLTPLLNLIKTPLFKKFVDDMVRFGSQAAKITGKGFADLVRVLMQLFIQLMPSGVKILRQLLPALVTMVTQLTPIIVLFANWFAIAVKWLAKNKLLVPALWLIVGALIAMKAAVLTNPVTLIAAAVILLAFVVIKYHKQIWSFLVRIWHDVFKFVKRIWDDILNFAKQWWPLLLGPAGLIIKYHKQIGGFFSRFWNDILNFFKTTWNKLWNGAKTAWGNIIGWFKNLPGRILGALMGLGTSLYNFAHQALTKFWNGLKSVFTGVWNWFKSLPGKLLHAIGIASPPDWAIQAGKHIMGGLLHGITSRKDELMSRMQAISGQMGGVAGRYTGGSGVGRWAGLVSRALGMEGLSQTLVRRVLFQMQTESGGNPRAINLTDINAQRGDPSRGLMQVIMSTFRAYHWPGTSMNIYDPLANIAAALNYARHVYGPSLMSGGMGIGSGHGYWTGGIGTGRFALVGERGRELMRVPSGASVYSNPDTERMLGGRGRAGEVTINLVLRGEQMRQELRKTIRVRYAGNVTAALGN